MCASVLLDRFSLLHNQNFFCPMFTTDDLLHQYYPRLNTRPLLGPPVRGFLRRILHEQMASEGGD